MDRVIYFHWLPFLTFILLLATTAVVYILFVSDTEPPRSLNLSTLLGGICSDSTAVRTAASIGVFGYNVTMTAMLFLFVRLWKRDLLGADTRGAREWAHFRLGVGMLGVLGFQFMLGFPSGFGGFADTLHQVSAGIGSGFLMFYAIFRFDGHNDVDGLSLALTIFRDLSIVFIVLSALAMLAAFILTRNDTVAWNFFSAAQLAFGIFFGLFLLSLTYTRRVQKGKEG